MKTMNWVGLVLLAAAGAACFGSEGTGFTAPPPEPPDGAPDSGGGAAGASAAEGGNASLDAGSEAAQEAGVEAGAMPDARSPEGGEGGLDAIDSGAEGGPEAGTDVGGFDRAPDSGDSEGGAPDSQPDRAPDAGVDGAVDGAIDTGPPPCGAFELEGVPISTYPHPLCGATTSAPGGSYQFSEIRLRSPIASPFQDRFVDGVMTVKNGAMVRTYMGVPSTATTGHEIAFHGAGGTDPIIFTLGVNEISVTANDALGRVGCLPPPCTWTVTP